MKYEIIITSITFYLITLLSVSCTKVIENDNRACKEKCNENWSNYTATATLNDSIYFIFDEVYFDPEDNTLSLNWDWYESPMGRECFYGHEIFITNLNFDTVHDSERYFEISRNNADSDSTKSYGAVFEKFYYDLGGNGFKIDTSLNMHSYLDFDNNCNDNEQSGIFELFFVAERPRKPDDITRYPSMPDTLRFTNGRFKAYRNCY